MSVVTNIVLCLHVIDADAGRVSDVNVFLAPDRLVSCDDPSLPKKWYGGTKMLEVEILVGAFNHLRLDAFVDHLREIDWQRPRNVQLFALEQEQERFRLINIVKEAG